LRLTQGATVEKLENLAAEKESQLQQTKELVEKLFVEKEENEKSQARKEK